MLAGGGLVVAVGGSASAMCDPMVDPRGGAFTLGLGLVTGLAFVSEAETWSLERLHRTLKLANTPVVCAPTGSAHRAPRRRVAARRGHRDARRPLTLDSSGPARNGRLVRLR